MEPVVTAGRTGSGCGTAHAPVDPDERAAIRRCQAGDADAFELLVRRYMRRASVFALGWTGDREDSLDVSQEAFVRAYRAIGSFDSARPFYPWFHQILRNLCLTRLKRVARLNEVPLEDRLDRLGEGGRVAGGALGTPGWNEGRGAGFDPQSAVERAELRRTVWEAIRSLPVNDREILVLREFQELTYAEIASVLDIPLGTVMSRLHAARTRLRDRLQPVFGSEGR